ncbi:uncharacterized protein LOC128306442 [Anopheles moucheti]|uniref:uncharacterized protein LOC128306442 n=1 Tax=Anopheles moucheti TaxID=186751 RepID=UPI0022F0BC13|nr:uncharacterized protein LOC128306442 [Anopheles moucheti]
MSTNENGASDASEEETRRSSLIRSSAFGPSHLFAPPPTQSVPSAPSQHPGTPSFPQAGSAPNPETAALYQMLQLMQQQMSQQQQMMAQMMQMHTTQRNPESQHQQQPLSPQQPELIMEALARSLIEFRYEAESNVTFEAWYARYEDLFKQDASRLDDAAKVRLLLRKLGTMEHSRYSNYILPRLPRDVSFEETVCILKSLFGSFESIVSKRYQCMQLAKTRSEDILAFICRVNRSCVDFQFSSMNEDQFKCLILVCGLKDETDAEIRTRLLARVEERNDVTLDELAAECRRIKHLKGDSVMIGAKSSDQVLAVHRGSLQTKPSHHHRATVQQRKPPQRKPNEPTVSGKPSRPCWLCGDLHWCLGQPPLNAASVCAKTASGDALQLDGEFEAEITLAGKRMNATVRVAPADVKLFGADLIELFDLGSIPMDAFCSVIGSEPFVKKPETEYGIASLELENDRR